MKEKKRHSTYMVFFLSYVLLLVITISSLFVYYAQIRTSVTRETQDSKQALLLQLKSNVDQKMAYADSLMNGIVSENKLQQFAAGYSYGTYNIQNLYSDIQSIYKPDYLVDYSAYFIRTGEVVSSGVHMNAAEYFRYMFSPVGMNYDAFHKKYLYGYRLRTFGPPINMQVTGGDEVNVLPYVQTFPFYGKPLGQIIILLNTKDIVKLISQLNTSTSSDVYILSGDDCVMLSSDSAPAPTKDLISAIHKNPDETFETKFDSQPMVVMSASSNQNGWKYVIVTPKNIYFQKSIHFAVICAVVVVVYLIIGLLMGHILAKRNSRPINEISDIIKKSLGVGDQIDGKNELRTIKSVLLDKFSTDRKLNDIIQAQKPVVTQAYLLALIKGLEANSEEILERLKSLGIEFVSEDFMAVAFEFDLDSPFFMEKPEFPEENYSFARVIVQNVGSEFFGKYFQNFFLDLDKNQSLFLLAALDNADAGNPTVRLKDGIMTLGKFVKDNFGLSINWGMSLLNNGYKSLPKCYDEARKALENSKRNSVDLVCFSDVKDVESDYFFPPEIEVQIISLLKSGSCREGKELLKNIFQINENGSHGLSPQASKRFLNAVVFMLVRTMNTVLTEKGKQPVPESLLTDEFGENPTLKSAEVCCLQFIDSITREAQNQVVGKTELLVEEITNFIDKNVEGNLLDLNFISEEFNLTPQYISNIFKRYKQENIKGYISRQKLNRAKKLLEDTDISSKEISVRLGYVNELGVFRLFKKYENMTPGKYRALHRKPAGGSKDSAGI